MAASAGKSPAQLDLSDARTFGGNQHWSIFERPPGNDRVHRCAHRLDAPYCSATRPRDNMEVDSTKRIDRHEDHLSWQ